IEITMDLDPSLGEVALDPKGIERCLQNLVSNAIDACIFDPSEGKKWAVHVRTMREDDTSIGFKVSDNGCGMDEEIKKRLFTSLFTTKEGRGTGLGLLNTQKIVKAHGGTITVDSEQGKGSTFTMRLPYRNMVPPEDRVQEYSSEPPLH
ncbi:MAG: histidine kinase, partial [Deltaproteobacteria bacterium]